MSRGFRPLIALMATSMHSELARRRQVQARSPGPSSAAFKTQVRDNTEVWILLRSMTPGTLRRRIVEHVEIST